MGTCQRVVFASALVHDPKVLDGDPALLVLGRRHGGFTDHAGFVGVGVEQAVAIAPAVAYRVRIDFKPDGWIEVVDAIIADNVKAELTLS